MAHVSSAFMARSSVKARRRAVLIALLRQATGNGFQDVGFMRTSEDFQALRGRDDFQRILKELERKGK